MLCVEYAARCDVQAPRLPEAIMIRLLSSLLVASIVVAFAPSSALAMRCGTHLIERGDTRIELLARCGEPTDVSRSVEQHTLALRGDNQAVARTVTIVVDSLLYNFGPTQLMRRVEVRDGRISQIQTLGQGFEPTAVANTDAPIRLGDERVRVRSRWGEPADRSLRSETRAASYRDAESVAVARTIIEVETWTYNFGPTRFMRRVSFENGRVVRVETLRPGF